MSLTRHLSLLLLVSLCFLTCGHFGKISRKQERLAYKVVSDPPWSRMDPKMTSILTLGHKSLYEDFITVWAVQFLADPDLPQKTTVEELSKSLNFIARQRPRIESYYLLGCFILAIDFKAPEHCDELSVAGLKAFPESWRIPMTQGFVSTLIERNDLKAAGFYQLAASRPQSPAYVSKLAARLAARGFADGQDLNETAEMFKEVPGGTKLISILRGRLRNTATPPRPSREATP